MVNDSDMASAILCFMKAMYVYFWRIWKHVWSMRTTTMVLWNRMFFSHTCGVLCIYSGGGVVNAWAIVDWSSCTYGDRGELKCKFHSAVSKHIWTAIGSYFLYLQDVLLLKPCTCATAVVWMWEVVAIRTAVPTDALFLVRTIWVTGVVDIFCHDIDINK
jgi:hypothetical protein